MDANIGLDGCYIEDDNPKKIGIDGIEVNDDLADQNPLNDITETEINFQPGNGQSQDISAIAGGQNHEFNPQREHALKNDYWIEKPLPYERNNHLIQNKNQNQGLNQIQNQIKGLQDNRNNYRNNQNETGSNELIDNHNMKNEQFLYRYR